MKTIQTKIVLLLSILLLFTLGVCLLVTGWVLETSQRESTLKAFHRANDLVHEQIKAKQQSLSTQVSLIGVLPILTTVVENGDPDTILDTSQSYQQDLGFEIMDIFDMDGELLVSVNNNFPDDVTDTLQTLIDAVLEEGITLSSISRRLQKISIISAAPIGDPEEPSGVLIVGHFLEETFAKQMYSFTGSNVTFFIDQQAHGSSFSATESQQALDLWSQHSDRLNEVVETSESLLEMESLMDINGQPVGDMMLEWSLMELKTVLNNIRQILLVLGLVLLLAAMAIGTFFAKALTRPIKKMVLVMQDIAQGDFTQRVEVGSKDEIGRLAVEFNMLITQLVSTLSQVLDSVVQINQDAQNLQQTSDTLAQGATTQAEAIEQSATSISGTSQSATQNQKNAEGTRTVMLNVQERAQEGSQQTQQMVDVMKEIDSSSQQIFKILSLIDQVAFQTKILSLNASIEAARAGAQGKGFAVVAEEVRSLASKSADATQKITATIQETVDKIKGGIQLAEGNTQTLDAIVESVSKTSSHMNSIVTASNEQAFNLQQLELGVQQMKQVTVQTADMAKNSKQTAQQLLHSAQVLKRATTRFKLSSAQNTSLLLEERQSTEISLPT